MRTSTAWILLCSVACGTPPDTPESPDGTADDDAWAPEERDDPYIDPEDDRSALTLDPAAVAAGVEAALWAVRSVHGQTVVDAYTEVMAGTDADCPAWGNQNGLVFWQDACTSEVGTTFDGYGYLSHYEDFPDGDIVWNGLGASLVASVTRSDGASLVGAGSALQLLGVNSAGADVFYSYLDEGFSYDGPAAAGTWLSGQGSPQLQTYAFSYPDGGKLLFATGRLQAETGPLLAVAFEELLLFNDTLGPCPAEPSGGVSVLLEGGWIDLTFNGPTFGTLEGFDASGCDGCGTAWHKGSALGEVCPDFSPLLSWESHPWEP